MNIMGGRASDSGRGLHILQAAGRNLDDVHRADLESIVRGDGGTDLILRRAKAMKLDKDLSRNLTEVKDSFGTKTYDAIMRNAYRFMLSSGFTPMKAASYNALLMVGDAGTHAFAGMWSLLGKNGLQNSKIQFTIAGNYFSGFWEGINKFRGEAVAAMKASKEAPHAYNYIDLNRSKLDMMPQDSSLSHKLADSDNILARGSGHALNWTAKKLDDIGVGSLMVVDDVFKIANLKPATYKLLAREGKRLGFEGKKLDNFINEGLEDVPEHIFNEALEEARAAVAQGSNTPIAEGFNKLLDKGKRNPFLRIPTLLAHLTMPFARTTESSLQQSLRYFGVAPPLKKGGSMRGWGAEFFSKDPDVRMEALGRFSFATATSGTALYLAMNDMMVGSVVPPHLKAEGATPFSAKVPFTDTWLSFKNSAQFKFIFGSTSDMLYGTFKESKFEGNETAVPMWEKFNGVKNAVMYNAMGVEDYNRNVIDFMNVMFPSKVKDYGSNVGTYLGKTISAPLVPQLLNTINRSAGFDNRFHELNGSGFFMDIVNPIIAKIPGLSHHVPGKTNELGEPRKRASVLEGQPVLMSLMGLEQPITGDPVREEIRKQFPNLRLPGKKLEEMGVSAHLEPHQTEYYRKQLAKVRDPRTKKNLRQSLDSLFKSNYYKNNPGMKDSDRESLETNTRANAIERIHSSFKQLAEKATINKYHKELANPLSNLINSKIERSTGSNPSLDLFDLTERLKRKTGSF